MELWTTTWPNERNETLFPIVADALEFSFRSDVSLRRAKVVEEKKKENKESLKKISLNWETNFMVWIQFISRGLARPFNSSRLFVGRGLAEN